MIEKNETLEIQHQLALKAAQESETRLSNMEKSFYEQESVLLAKLDKANSKAEVGVV